jgi:hypothetical protein
MLFFFYPHNDLWYNIIWEEVPLRSCYTHLPIAQECDAPVQQFIIALPVQTQPSQPQSSSPIAYFPFKNWFRLLFRPTGTNSTNDNDRRRLASNVHITKRPVVLLSTTAGAIAFGSIAATLSNAEVNLWSFLYIWRWHFMSTCACRHLERWSNLPVLGFRGKPVLIEIKKRELSFGLLFLSVKYSTTLHFSEEK